MLLALTGATGFIGQHLLRELPKRGYRLRVLLRRPTAVPTWSASAGSWRRRLIRAAVCSANQLKRGANVPAARRRAR